MKCLVKYCPNHSSEGRFVGSLCSPCYEALKEGCKHEFMKERLVPEYKELADLIYKINRILGKDWIQTIARNLRG